MDQIKVCAVNFPDRIEKKIQLLKQFNGRDEFSLHQITGIRHHTGILDLWKTIQHAIKYEVKESDKFFILCEDSHQFTPQYSKDFLKGAIEDAQRVNADILCGGVNWLRGGIQVPQNIFWVETFFGLQFTIIFKSLYNKILGVSSFKDNETTDFVLSRLTDRKFVIHPFISVQCESGNSDAIYRSNEAGRVGSSFKDASKTIDRLKDIRNIYL